MSLNDICGWLYLPFRITPAKVQNMVVVPACRQAGLRAEPSSAKVQNMVVVAQLVRALVCGTKGRGFEPHLPPKIKAS